MSQHHNVLPSRFIVQELEEYTDREKRLLKELDSRLDRLQATSARLETLSIDIQEA